MNINQIYNGPRTFDRVSVVTGTSKFEGEVYNLMEADLLNIKYIILTDDGDFRIAYIDEITDITRNDHKRLGFISNLKEGDTIDYITVSRRYHIKDEEIDEDSYEEFISIEGGTVFDARCDDGIVMVDVLEDPNWQSLCVVKFDNIIHKL
jgi:hypothetical protein